jgi:hypothetical protein
MPLDIPVARSLSGSKVKFLTSPEGDARGVSIAGIFALFARRSTGGTVPLFPGTRPDRK